MPKVPVENLEAGMKTAKPVVNASGMVLLGENTELTPELIDRIRNMAVEGVYIHGSSKPSVPLMTYLATVDNRFRLVGSEPHMDVIRAAIRKHVEALYE